MSTQIEEKKKQVQQGTEMKVIVLEDAVYPPEFLTFMKETAFDALYQYLARTAAPKEVTALLEDIQIFTSWQGEMENGKVEWLANQWMMDCIANMTRNFVAIGGVFHCPFGDTYQRNIDS